MQTGKILLGVGIGIGAIAAAPFTGGGSVLAAGVSLGTALTGAGTGIAVGAAAATAGGAVVGGGVGAALGAADEEKRRKERQKAKKRGFEDGRKKGEVETKKKVSKIIGDTKKRDDYLVALTSLCYAAAYCDGKITEEEQDELDYFLNYIKTNGALPAPLKGELTKIKETKAPFEKITNKLDKIATKDLATFGKIIDSIIEADDILDPAEEIFKEKWEKYCEQRKS